MIKSGLIIKNKSDIKISNKIKFGLLSPLHINTFKINSAKQTIKL